MISNLVIRPATSAFKVTSSLARIVPVLCTTSSKITGVMIFTSTATGALFPDHHRPVFVQMEAKTLIRNKAPITSRMMIKVLARIIIRFG
ncbi:MAG: hypothetical protein IPN36_07165 [Bacteroidetes bacterium]|nr:hypothetical protein [Bacteroidota bacterium]